MFRKTANLWKALRYQITAAVPEDFLDALRNREVNASTVILEYLFDNYKTVEQEVVLKEEQSIREHKYLSPTSLVAIFNKMKDLQHLTTEAHNPYTEI